jgi:hypothetical protein
MFLFVIEKSPKPQHLLSCSWYHSNAPLMNEDASSWFHNVSTYGEEVIEYGTILSLKSHLNENY